MPVTGEAGLGLARDGAAEGVRVRVELVHRVGGDGPHCLHLRARSGLDQILKCFVHAPGEVRLPRPLEGRRGLFELTQALVSEAEVAGGALVLRAQLEQLAEGVACAEQLSRLQVAEPEIETRSLGLRPRMHDFFEDVNGTRIHAQAEVDDGQEPLAFDVFGLKPQRALELFLGLAHAVLFQELAAAIQMEQEVFGGEGSAGRQLRLARAGARLGAHDGLFPGNAGALRFEGGQGAGVGAKAGAGHRWPA